MNSPSSEQRARYPFIDLLERDAAAMRSELDAIDPAAFVPMPNYPNGWTAFLLDGGRWVSEFPGVDFARNRLRCPHSYHVVAGIDGLVLAGFLRLEAGGFIEEHSDIREDDVVRCHVGLHLSPGERSYWPELGARLMDVRQPHAARNDGPTPRLTLVVDVRMPFVVPEGEFGPWQPAR